MTRDRITTLNYDRILNRESGRFLRFNLRRRELTGVNMVRRYNQAVAYQRSNHG